MQHLSRYGTRLFEEEKRKKKMNNSDFQLLVILEQVLDTMTAAVDWGSRL